MTIVIYDCYIFILPATGGKFDLKRQRRSKRTFVETKWERERSVKEREGEKEREKSKRRMRKSRRDGVREGLERA